MYKGRAFKPFEAQKKKLKSANTKSNNRETKEYIDHPMMHMVTEASVMFPRVNGVTD